MPYARKQTPIRRNKNTAVKAYLFLAPSLLGVAAFVLIPFLDVIRRSFYEAMGGRFVGLKNYQTVLTNEAFHQAAFNTGRFLLSCIPLLLLLSFLVALCIQGLCGSGEWFKTIFLTPMAIPVASIVLLWQLMFDEKGYLNQITAVFHMSPVDWMNGATAFYVLVFSYLWKNIGYDIILWLAGLNGISPALYEAARVDGAGRWQCFRYITLPELRPTVFLIGVLSFVNSFKVFREAYLIAGDYPDSSIYMLQHLFNNWFVSLDIQKMSAAAVLTALVITTFLLVVQHRNERNAED